MAEPDDTIGAYSHGVAEFAARFESVFAEDLWAPVREFIPTGANRIGLDVGAGVGRDTAWLKSLGLEMVAVEPAEGMREFGQARYPNIRWLDDRLPDLTKVHRLSLAFDLILLSGVWQHLRPAERPRAFRKLVTLLKPGGLLILTLRHGTGGAGRAWHETSLGEIEALARDFGLSVLRALEAPDALGREGVDWTLACLRLPDDGSVGLPLIRGIVLSDAKSSTYKLGLLRSVAKVADVAPALAVAERFSDADRVSVPLGLVALNWLRAYLPLVKAGLPQLPGNSGPDGLGFAGLGFRALIGLGVAAEELRVGASFAGERAAALAAALGEARRTIINMPVRYTTAPNSTAQVFEASGHVEARALGGFSLTPEILQMWGQLSMAGPLWRTLLRLGAWIEPLFVAEWARMMGDYAERMGRIVAPGVAEAHLIWQEPGRDTRLARAIAGDLAAAGTPIHCVWSGATLALLDLDIDHAVPWSAWPCGDLWNLAPASRRVNQNLKRDRLPTAAALAAARGPILEWWGGAWRSNPALAARFAAEVMAALPIEGQVTAESAFAGMEWRRLCVEQNQQPPLWAGVGAAYRQRGHRVDAVNTGV